MAEHTPSKLEKPLKVGQRVDVVKDNEMKLRGTVAYVGTTLFSPGKWIGVILDENKGKNNGTVMGKTYFSCKDGYGLFIRQTNCIVLDEVIEEPTCETPYSEEKQKIKSRLPVAASKTPLPSSNPIASSISPDIPVSVKDESSTQPPSTPRGEVTTKRSSFIETGFVETLKAQFTPGQPLSPSLSMAIEERVTGMHLQHENENLKSEIRDLTEKLETLKVRRNQDKEKLKEADKMRLQLDQLLEFKKAILESQAQLQKELQRAKQEAKEAMMEKQSKIDDSDDYQEMLEMATLDKEMAEEKAESLQIELEQAKQKIEELTLDLELLKAEMSEKGIEGAGSSLEIKQLEQQNSRLKDTLVKMRDLAAHEKHQQHRLQKDLEEKNAEINDLKKAKVSLLGQLEEQRKVIAELQEQVDAALGAEEMVEQLTDRNLALEEKIGELQDAVADLEQLHDMNEELQETARETELELREELDMTRTKVREIGKERDAALEMVADRNSTIEKFREVVQQLQTSNQELRDELQRETKKPVGALPEMIDYKKIFTESKTFTKTIDLELRKLDVQQALQHVQYLCTYMPDSFMARGGDYHSVQVLLLISRLLFKSDILATQVKEKFPSIEKGDSTTTLKSHAAEQFSFGSRLLYLLFGLQTICRQYSNALNCCSPEKFLEMGSLYPEMVMQEKNLDYYVHLLRKDQLDENVSLDGLEKTTAYLNNVYLANFSTLCNGMYFLTDQAKTLSAASDTLMVDCNRIHSMMQTGHEGSDVAITVREIVTQVTQWKQFSRTIKRRLPTDGSAGPISLSPESVTKMRQASCYMLRLVKTMQEWCRMVSQQLLILTEVDAGVPVSKMRELAHAAADKIYIDEDYSDGGFHESVRNSLSAVTTTYSAISCALVDGQYDFDGSPSAEATSPPVVVRAQNLKAEIKDLENLRHKLEQREAIIKEINALLRNKQEELSEMNIRKEMAEKKLASANRDNELALEKLARKLEDNQLLLKRKEKEFHETLEHLQSDMETLEKEKAELKERLMHSSKKVLLEGLTKSTVAFNNPVSLLATSQSQANLGSGSPPTLRDSPLLMNEVSYLRQALRHSQSERAFLAAEQLRSKLETLSPILIPRKNELHTPSTGTPLKQLTKKTEDLKLALLRSCAQSRIDPGQKLTNQHSTKKDQLKVTEIEQDVLNLKISVARLAAMRHPGGHVSSKLSSFPIPELTKILESNQFEKIGKLILPASNNSSSDISETIALGLQLEELRNLHNSLMH